MKWQVLKSDGTARLNVNSEEVWVHSLEYSGTWMGECFITVDIKSAYPINFGIGDYITYRGENFSIGYDPTVQKVSSRGSYAEGFVYSGIKFSAASDEMTRCTFLDFTVNDNEIHYSCLPEFTFYASSVRELADRIQANLNRIYTGDKAWSVRIVKTDGTIYDSSSSEQSSIISEDLFPGEKNINVQVSSIYCWDALALARSQFNLNFIVRGRIVTIAPQTVSSGSMFYKDGLKEITKSSDSSQQIVTRLHAYGSEKNMPWRYYADIEDDNPIHANNLAIKRLMLPGFPTETLDPYIDSDNIDVLGIREATVFFDKEDPENGIKEVYPTLEEMTAGEAENHMYPADTRLDEILGWENVINGDDPTLDGYVNGYWDPKIYSTIPPFKLYIRYIADDFSLLEALSKNSFKIVMKDGMCGARDFAVASCEQVMYSGSPAWCLTCARCQDSGLDIYFPCQNQPLNYDAVDHFVIEDIELPAVYIRAASNRLKTLAEAYLAKNCTTRYTYTPAVDNIWMARQHDSTSTGTSLHDTLKEGDMLMFNDDDVQVNESITIDQLNIKEGSSLIPEYTITLRNEKEVGTIQKIQNKINAIEQNGVGGGISSSELRTLGSSLFLSKKNDDTAEGNIKFAKQASSTDFVSGGAGWGAYKDAGGGSYFESDYLNVRRSAYFRMLTIAEVKHIGGELILSAAASQLSKVETVTISSGTYSGQQAYRCYFDTTANGKTVYNEWEVGDQAYCKVTKPVAGQSEGEVMQYYWRLVIGIGENYIDLSTRDYATGSKAPLVNDNVVLLGSRGSSAYRKSAQVYSTANGNSPSRIYYSGINSYSLSGKAVEIMEHTSNGPHWRVGNANSFVNFENSTLSIQMGSTNVGDALGEKFDTYIDDTHNAPKSDGEVLQRFLYNAYDYLPSIDWTLEECGTNLGSFYLTLDGFSYKFVLENSLYYWRLTADKYLVDAMNSATESASRLTKMGDDNVVTLQEKTTIKTIWEGINAEYDNTISNASLYGGSADVTAKLNSYKDGYAALGAVMNTILITEAGIDSPLLDEDGVERTFTWYQGSIPYGVTYNTAWDNYYRRKALLDYAISGATIAMIDQIAIDKGGYDAAVAARLQTLESEYGELNGAWSGFSSTGFYNYIRNEAPGATYSGALLTTANFTALANQITTDEGVTVSAIMGTYVTKDGDLYMSGAKITADLIDLEGKTMSFTGNQITVNTNNFKLKENGDVEIKGDINAGSDTMMNSTFIDGDSGEFTMYGPSVVQDTAPYYPATGATKTPLVSIKYSTDLDRSARCGVMTFRCMNTDTIRIDGAKNNPHLKISEEAGSWSYLNTFGLNFYQNNTLIGGLSNNALKIGEARVTNDYIIIGDDDNYVKITKNGIEKYVNGERTGDAFAHYVPPVSDEEAG